MTIVLETMSQVMRFGWIRGMPWPSKLRVLALKGKRVLDEIEEQAAIGACGSVKGSVISPGETNSARKRCRQGTDRPLTVSC
jgi:hypothetical protein